MTTEATEAADLRRFRGVKDDLVRMDLAPVRLMRAAGEGDAGDGAEGDGRTMFGNFAVYNRWTEIDSFWEGRFMEQIAPGTFAKTFREDRAGMRVLTEHGRDPHFGNRALGPIDVLLEDKAGEKTGEPGAYYEVPLVNADDVNGLLLPRLEQGLYGASFRFQVMREEVVDEPGASDHNPMGMQERTIKEARVFEFGPVTFPAYAEASADVRCRSLTDEVVPAARMASDREVLLARLDVDPELRAALFERAEQWRTRPTADFPGRVDDQAPPRALRQVQRGRSGGRAPLPVVVPRGDRSGPFVPLPPR